jgi:hypothetical protein
MKKLPIIFFLFITFVIVMNFLIPIEILGQTSSPHNNCEENNSLFYQVEDLKKHGDSIIIVATQGSKEKTNLYNTKRLNVFRMFLGDDGIVFAFGVKSVIKPRVEIYVNGKLGFIFETKNKEKLKVFGCGN